MKLPSKEKCLELAAPGRPHYVPDDYLMFVIHRAYREGAAAMREEAKEVCRAKAILQDDAYRYGLTPCNGDLADMLYEAIRNLKVEE